MEKEILINTLIKEVEKRVQWYSGASYGSLEYSMSETLELIIDILKLLNGQNQKEISNSWITEELEKTIDK